jgi:hypothetical protein
MEKIAKKPTGKDPIAQKLCALAEKSFDTFAGALLAHAQGLDLSHPEDVVGFFTKTPEELKLFINQSYASALLDQKISNAPDITSAWTSPLDTLSCTITGFKLVASAKAADLVKHLKSLENTLNARHNAETERLIDRCNEANSGTIVVDGSIGDYIAYSAYESTVNRNKFSTERAIAQDLAENQDEYNHYVVNYGRLDLLQYLQEALPFIAEGVFTALVSKLLAPLGAEAADYLPSEATSRQLRLLGQAGRDEELQALARKTVEEKPICFSLIGFIPSLREELFLRAGYGLSSLIAASYAGWRNRSLVPDERSKRIPPASTLAELYDFAENNPECAPAFKNYLLYACGPYAYTGVDYGPFVSKLVELGWSSDPLFVKNYSPEESRRMLNDYFSNTGVAYTKRLYQQNLYHYCRDEKHWRCLCGAINNAGEDTCCFCGKKEQEIAALEANPYLITSELRVKRQNSAPYLLKQKTILYIFIAAWITLLASVIALAQGLAFFGFAFAADLLLLILSIAVFAADRVSPADGPTRARVFLIMDLALIVGVLIGIFVNYGHTDGGLPAIGGTLGGVFVVLGGLIAVAGCAQIGKKNAAHNI